MPLYGCHLSKYICPRIIEMRICLVQQKILGRGKNLDIHTGFQGSGGKGVSQGLKIDIRNAIPTRKQHQFRLGVGVKIGVKDRLIDLIYLKKLEKPPFSIQKRWFLWLRRQDSVCACDGHLAKSVLRISPVGVPGECPWRWSACVPRRPRPLAQVAPPATGGAPIAPHNELRSSVS